MRFVHYLLELDCVRYEQAPPALHIPQTAADFDKQCLAASGLCVMIFINPRGVSKEDGNAINQIAEAHRDKPLSFVIINRSVLVVSDPHSRLTC